LKKQSGHKKRGKRDSPKFARYLFWISWIWVLLFAVGELLEAVKIEGYGDKIIFCVVTILALGSGGFVLERTLKVGAANKSRRSQVNERRASNGVTPEETRGGDCPGAADPGSRSPCRRGQVRRTIEAP
jgi:hypothetical protein